MNKLKELFRQEGVLVIFVIVCVLLFNWHFIGLSEKVDGFDSFRYLFGVWALVIVLLFMIARSNKCSLSKDYQYNKGCADSDARTELSSEDSKTENVDIENNV